jgi:imidazolonepropionase-like amidohydrolase
VTRARFALAAAFAAGLALSTAPARGQAPSRAAIVIRDVAVIDPRLESPVRGRTVVIEGDRIVRVGPAAATSIPAGATIIDGRGRFLIPGLWDMHVHTSVPAGRSVLGLYVANGVTGVRDMAAEWDTITAWRSDIAAERLDGPRLLASGPYLEGGPQPMVPHILTRTPAEGRAGVDSLVRLGVDVVKVHGQLTPATYFAIARRARERGIPFAGHVSRAVGAAAASDSGQRSIEHLLGVPMPCTAADSVALAPRFAVQGALGRCSSEDLAPLYARFVRNGTWVTPTYTAMVEIAGWPRREVPGDRYAAALPDTLRRFTAALFPLPDSIPPGADVTGRAILAKRLAQAGAMQRAGVRIMTGTDAPLRNSPPGFGLHQELELLVEGGLTPREALFAATFEPARYLGIDSIAGTIAADKRADLVLLEADPLLDIRNTRRIVAVIAAGRLYDDAARRRLSARARGSAR